MEKEIIEKLFELEEQYYCFVNGDCDPNYYHVLLISCIKDGRKYFDQVSSMQKGSITETFINFIRITGVNKYTIRYIAYEIDDKGMISDNIKKVETTKLYC